MSTYHNINNITAGVYLLLQLLVCFLEFLRVQRHTYFEDTFLERGASKRGVPIARKRVRLFLGAVLNSIYAPHTHISSITTLDPLLVSIRLFQQSSYNSSILKSFTKIYKYSIHFAQLGLKKKNLIEVDDGTGVGGETLLITLTC